MNKNLLRSILLIITYSVVLVLVLVKIDLIWAVAAQILGALKPLFLGFAIAFVLNRPCTFFFRLYHGGLAGRKLDRFSRPLAVLSAYVALVVVVTATVPYCRSSRARWYIRVVLPPPPMRAVMPGRMPSRSHSFSISSILPLDRICGVGAIVP